MFVYYVQTLYIHIMFKTCQKHIFFWSGSLVTRIHLIK